MKKTHFQRFSLLAALVVFTACGSENTNSGTPSTNDQVQNPQKRSFQIKDTTWDITIPNGWIYIAPPQANTPTIVLAQNQSSNFVMLQKPGPIPTMEAFQTQAQEDFYTYQFGANNETTWQFQGQLSIEDAPRVFVQKVFAIPNTNNYLYGSCSYELSVSNVSDCETLLNNWVQNSSVTSENA